MAENDEHLPEPDADAPLARPTESQASGDTPAKPLTPEASSPTKRPWTILGRLSKAVREQNWFAVVLELLIVIVGVVIGFQVTAWGQARSDAKLERAYLEQLHADLVASEEDLGDVIVFFERRALAAAAITHAFWQDDLPPEDSLAAWMNRPFSSWRYRPVVGTAKALVSTGNHRLVSDDSLRTLITTYVDRIEAELDDVQRYDETYYQPARTLLPDDFDTGALDVLLRDSTDAPPSPLSSVPRDYDTIPFPMDFDAVMNDSRVYSAYRKLLVAHRGTRGRYRVILRQTERLRERVERALED